VNLLRRYSLPAGLLCAATLFAALAGRFAVIVRPNSNEAWFADAARNLLLHGHLGTTIISAQGTWLEGIERHTYWAMPVHLLTQAGWYSVFGFGLISQRSLSVAAGLVMILAWFVVVERLTLRRSAALAALALLAADARLGRWASNGRMDALCAALGVGGLALFLLLRSRSPRLAVAAGHAAVALSGLTHPCGAVYALDLVLLQLVLDGWRRTRQYAAWLFAPYLVFGAAFAAWAWQDWPSFLRQFGGNISGVAGEYSDVERFSAFRHPWNAFYDEIRNRFLNNFRGRLSFAILWTYAAGFIWMFPRRAWRAEAGARALFYLASVHLLFFWLFEGLKLGNYLVHALPVFIVVTVFAGADMFRTRPRVRSAAFAALLLLLLVTSGRELRERSYQDVYQPVASHLLARPLARIMAPPEFAFAAGFEGRLQDDPRLGAYTGRQADIFVTNSWQRRWINRTQLFDPGAEAAQAKLKAEFEIVYRNSEYVVWERTGWSTPNPP
jgi:4-amino-4-deoxy-L-arabinose transferase-like glycosyltransferase